MQELIQNNNDIYFFEMLSDKVVINDNYDGILILNSELNLIKKLSIYDGITVYSSFINYINDEILLFCPDNECLVYINLKNYDYILIVLNNGHENLVFSNNYEWNENGLILTTCKGDFYKICIEEKTIKHVLYNEIEELYPKLYRLYQNKLKIAKLFPDDYVASIDDEQKFINIFNVGNKKLHKIYNFYDDFHDIEYRDEVFVLVSENKIEIITSSDKSVLYPNEDYIFLKAKFLYKPDSIFLIILNSSRSDCNNTKMDMYQLCFM